MGAKKIMWRNETRCYTFPPRVCAETLSYEHINMVDNLLSASLPLLNIQILLIFVVSNSLNFFLRRLRIPSFVGQALTGVILGPTLLGRTEFFKNKLFPHSSQTNLDLIAFLGYGTFMFLVGVKMDMTMFTTSRKKVLTIGLASLVFPAFIGIAVQQPKLHSAKTRSATTQIFVITEVQSLTSFAVISHLINELRLTNSEIGRLAMSSSLVAGSCSLVFQIGTSAFAKSANTHSRLIDVGIVVLALVFASFVLRPAVVNLVVKKTRADERVNPGSVVAISALAVAYAIFFDWRREPFILGLFLFGIFVVPPGPPLGSSLVQTLEPLPQALFFPVFVATSVMKADLISVFSEFNGRAYFSALIFWIAILKFAICSLVSLRWLTMLDSIVLSLILSSKGIVDLSINAYMRDVQLVRPQLFSLFILAIIVNATLIPIIVSFLYEPTRRYARYHSKNIFALKPFTELRILTCIHKLHHVHLATKLLDTLCRTEDSVVALYVIHLLEQIGHATPMFICHQKQKKSPSDDEVPHYTPSLDVIFAFTQYERKNVGFTSLQSFTAISQYKFMQEDIFTL
ncbi:Cation/H(+) antiporter 3, partial [Linum grandiflorum]